jgi:hypothetical protein
MHDGLSIIMLDLIAVFEHPSGHEN